MSTRKDIAKLLQLVNEDQQPNVSELWLALRDISAIRLNIKNLGYHLAKTLNDELASVSPAPVHPGRVGACKQSIDPGRHRVEVVQILVSPVAGETDLPPQTVGVCISASSARGPGVSHARAYRTGVRVR